MKRIFSIILSASAASLLAFSALAQDPLNPKKDGPSSVSDRLSQARRGDQLNDAARASDVIGMTVKNLQDEKLGKVENILVDLSSGRVVALVVSSGGFLGMGDELSAVPPAALEFSADRTTLHLDASKSMLSEAPHFKAHQWPDFSQSSYVLGVYRAFRVEPYFTTNVTARADNTARNVRDRDEATLTPLDQGTSKADVNTTAEIRKRIVARKSMSVNATNVKIITLHGRVTLRGRLR